MDGLKFSVKPNIMITFKTSREEEGKSERAGEDSTYLVRILEQFGSFYMYNMCVCVL